MSKLTDKLKSVKKSTWITAGSFAAAGALILTAAIGGTQAALTYFSDDYSAEVELYDIGVSLVENDEIVAFRNYVAGSDGEWAMGSTPLLEDLLEGADEPYVVIGKTYDEVLSVENSGTIDEYVRVKVYKYWTNDKDEKVTVLSPNLIDLHYVTGDWEIVSETDENTVLYYRKLLPSGARTSAFTDTVTVYIDDSLTADVIEERDGNIIRYTYKYDKYKFHIECEVDAVQDHNAQDAMLSAWGVVY